MKKLILITVTYLIFTLNINAQIRFLDREYFNASISIDPLGSIDTKSPNLIGELELVSNWGYVKATTQINPGIEGNYFDFGTAMGINVVTDKFETFRLFSGIRLGIINRGGNNYPLFGFEAGIDYNINNKVFLRYRGTADYREDFEFWGGEAKYLLNSSIGIGFKF